MSTSSDFAEFVKEQLAAVHGVQAKRLFSGVGLSAHGVQFAMIIDNVLYFVVDDATRPAYEAMGSQCFSYTTKVRHVEVRRYYAVPGEVIEDRQRLAMLARESLEIAARPRKSPKPKPRKMAKASR
ncbi:TfoX/Sxy family protein [Variovorax ureilyticus]|uniref:TfoX/Sxy family protein n=1 Tax=Variovorax ureilyticus TaxID=1836198 RepID=A0ABU8VNT2_9BURK